MLPQIITKGPQALLRHLYFMYQKNWQLKDRRLPIVPNVDGHAVSHWLYLLLQ